MATYRVIGALAVVRDESKSERYIYRGGVFDDAAADKASIKHLVKTKLIELVPEPVKAEPVKAEPVKAEPVKAEPDEGAYKGVSVADLKAEIAKRNDGRADEAKIVPAEPGNRPEIVAALIADDNKQ